MGNETTPILAGLRGVEIGTDLAGAMAARLLAESGASVLRIDDLSAPAQESPASAAWHRSKEVVGLDLGTREGRERLLERIGQADFLIHSLPAARVAELGLTPETLLKTYPNLVLCPLTSFPAGHRLAGVLPRDNLVMGASGMLDEHLAANGRDGPVYSMVPMASIGAWHLAAAGIVARLIARTRDGRGGLAATTMLQGALTAMMSLWTRGDAPNYTTRSRTGSRNVAPDGPGIARYRSSDGLWMHIMGPPDALPLMAEVLAEIGEAVPQLGSSRPRATDYAYVGMPEKVKRRAFQQRPRAEWLKALSAAGIPSGACQQLGELFHDEQARLNGFVAEVQHPVHGPTLQPGIPFTTEPLPSIDAPKNRSTPRVEAKAVASRVSPGTAAPLAGLKVLDFGQFVAGPFPPQFLADLGADVIKVEAIAGDAVRPDPKAALQSARAFTSTNRGKRSLAVDLKSPEARPILEKLLGWADVVVHNIRLDAARRIGLDPDSLRARHPGLICCHIDAYGKIGPQTPSPGYDPLFQAAAGWEVESAGAGNPPTWSRTTYMDYHTGLSALVAALLAIYRRTQTGEGQTCGASMLATAMQSLSQYVVADGNVLPERKLDAEQTGISPYQRLYQCDDRRWLVIEAEEKAEQEAVLRALNIDAPDQIGNALATMSRDLAISRLAAHGAPVAPALQEQHAAFFDSAENRACGLVTSYVSAEFGRIEQVGAFWDLGDLKLTLDRAPPALGEHTSEIVRELGISDGESASLIERGVLRGTF